MRKRERITPALKRTLAVVICAMMLAGCGKDKDAVTDTLALAESIVEESVAVESTVDVETTEEAAESSTEEITEEATPVTESVEEEETPETEEAIAESEAADVKEETQETKPGEEADAQPSQTPEPQHSMEPEPTPQPSVEPEPTPQPSEQPEPTPQPSEEPEPSVEPEPVPPSEEPEPEPHVHTMYENWHYYPTCTSGGYMNYQCSECGYIDWSKSGTVQMLPHTPVGRIIVKGDCVSCSVTRYSCSVCGLDQCQPDTESEGPGQPDAHNWVTGSWEELDPTTLEYILHEVTCCSRCGKGIDE